MQACCGVPDLILANNWSWLELSDLGRCFQTPRNFVPLARTRHGQPVPAARVHSCRTRLNLIVGVCLPRLSCLFWELEGIAGDSKWGWGRACLNARGAQENLWPKFFLWSARLRATSSV